MFILNFIGWCVFWTDCRGGITVLAARQRFNVLADDRRDWCRRLICVWYDFLPAFRERRRWRRARWFRRVGDRVSIGFDGRTVQ